MKDAITEPRWSLTYTLLWSMAIDELGDPWAGYLAWKKAYCIDNSRPYIPSVWD